jgi:hypothetical protein
MPAERLSMRKVREVLRLTVSGVRGDNGPSFHLTD